MTVIELMSRETSVWEHVIDYRNAGRSFRLSHSVAAALLGILTDPVKKESAEVLGPVDPPFTLYATWLRISIGSRQTPH